MITNDIEFEDVKVMGNILNPTIENSFTSLVKFKDKNIFVDKTDFIEITNNRLNDNDCFMVVSLPRKFGKTVMSHMLLAYYGKEYVGQNIFDNLKISKAASYIEHMNMHDVIYIDMTTIKDQYNSYKSDNSLYIDGIDDIVDFLQYMVIQDLKKNKEYAEQIKSDPLIGKQSLLSALEVICQYTGETFIFIMDEYDLIYREYRNEKNLQEKFIKFLRGLFKSDCGRACFALAYLTGILPIKKYNSQSTLNNLDEYNMLTPGNFAPYFGFTENEVANILKSHVCKISQEKLEEWYKGYKVRDIDIYNPYSICKAIRQNECTCYWSEISSNEEFISLINMNFVGMRDDIINLIEGSAILFNFTTFGNDLVSIANKDDIFSLLVCLGYLGGAEEEGNYRIAYVPNKEIRNALYSLVKAQPWFNSMPVIERSESLFNSIKSLDGNTTAKIITEIHNSPNVSLLTYNKEESMVFCLISGLMWSAERKYECFRELQSGKGSADLIYVPKRNPQLPILLIEFKYAKSAEEAIDQIKEKEYFSRYRDGDYPNDVLLIGINYSPKTKDHQCLIEKLDQ